MSGPEPGSREWNRLITASKVPAIIAPLVRELDAFLDASPVSRPGVTA